jgi:hypothetical protein
LDDVHGQPWFVDGSRVNMVRPSPFGSLRYPPNPDPPAGRGRLQHEVEFMSIWELPQVTVASHAKITHDHDATMVSVPR